MNHKFLGWLRYYFLMFHVWVNQLCHRSFVTMFTSLSDSILTSWCDATEGRKIILVYLNRLCRQLYCRDFYCLVHLLQIPHTKFWSRYQYTLSLECIKGNGQCISMIICKTLQFTTITREDLELFDKPLYITTYCTIQINKDYVEVNIAE